MKTVRYARTYNLGNYESERFELEAQMPDETSDLEAFDELKARIEDVRSKLPANSSARPAAREQANRQL